MVEVGGIRSIIDGRGCGQHALGPRARDGAAHRHAQKGAEEEEVVEGEGGLQPKSLLHLSLRASYV